MKDILKSFEWVRRKTGKSITRQLAEVLHLKRRSQLFGLSDYFDYQLYRDDFPSDVRKEDFAGWRMELWLDEQLNPREYRMLCSDKLVAYQLLRGNDVPFPTVRAVFSRDRRIFPGAVSLASVRELTEWLRQKENYPVFAKPVRGVRGAGVWGMVGHDDATGMISLTNGSQIRVTDLAEELVKKRPSVVPAAGYVFQDLVQQHSSIRQLVSSGICSVRLVLLVTDEVAIPFRSMWRVAVGANMHDNYVKGRTGNLVGEVDLEAGTIGRVVRRNGLEEIDHENHPDTGRRLRGFVLPDWNKLVLLCQRAAYTFPMLRFQHWDIALSEAGPVVLEVNTTGGIDMIQYSSHRGLYDEQLRGFTAKYGSG